MGSRWRPFASGSLIVSGKEDTCMLVCSLRALRKTFAFRCTRNPDVKYRSDEENNYKVGKSSFMLESLNVDMVTSILLSVFNL